MKLNHRALDQRLQTMLSKNYSALNPVYQKNVPVGGKDMDWTLMFGDRIKSSGPSLTVTERVAKEKRDKAEKKRNA